MLKAKIHNLASSMFKKPFVLISETKALELMFFIFECRKNYSKNFPKLSQTSSGGIVNSDICDNI